jgi:hypothetical protein
LKTAKLGKIITADNFKPIMPKPLDSPLFDFDLPYTMTTPAWPDITHEKKGIEKMSKILDSGERRKFESGAVRDIVDNKGRCDLLPLEVLGLYYSENGHAKDIFLSIDRYIRKGTVGILYEVLDNFNEDHWKDTKTMFLEVSKHYEEGAKKYAERNWEKGIPMHCYIDSAVRHYLKFLRGDTDEPHDRAFVWNILCAIWTHLNKPQLIDLPFNDKVSNDDLKARVDSFLNDEKENNHE